MKFLLALSLIVVCSSCFGSNDNDSIPTDTVTTILLIKPKPQVNLFELQLAKQLCYKAFFCRLEDDLSTKHFRVNVGVDVR